MKAMGRIPLLSESANDKHLKKYEKVSIFTMQQFHKGMKCTEHNAFAGYRNLSNQIITS